MHLRPNKPAYKGHKEMVSDMQPAIGPGGPYGAHGGRGKVTEGRHIMPQAGGKRESKRDRKKGLRPKHRSYEKHV